MKILFLDTSIKGILLSLGELSQDENVRIISTKWHQDTKGGSSILASLSHEVLSQQSLSIHDIKQLVVGIGPGSFTGIKIGISFALGMKRSIPNLRVRGVSAFRGLGNWANDLEREAWVLPVNSSSAFLMSKGSFGSEILAMSAENNWQVERKKAIQQSESIELSYWEKIKVIGTLPKLRESIERIRGSQAKIEDHDISQLTDIFKEAMVAEFLEQVKSQDEVPLKPLYMKKSAPEEKLEVRSKHL